MALHPTEVVRFSWFTYLFIFENNDTADPCLSWDPLPLTSFSLGLLPRGLHCHIMDYLCNEVTVKAESYLCSVLCKSCCCCVQQCYGAWKICRPVTVVMHWSRKELASAADEQLDGVLTRQMCVACKKTERGLQRQCGYWYKTVCTVCQQFELPTWNVHGRNAWDAVHGTHSMCRKGSHGLDRFCFRLLNIWAQHVLFRLL